MLNLANYLNLAKVHGEFGFGHLKYIGFAIYLLIINSYSVNYGEQANMFIFCSYVL